MAVLVIGAFSGGDASADAQMQQELGVIESPPAGAIARFAGPSREGYRVVSVWESEQAFESFKRDRLLPGLERLGTTAPRFEVATLDNFRIAGR